MSSHRIVLANKARFMRTTLRRLLDKNEQLEVVAEVDALDQVPEVLDRTRPDWLLVSLPEADQGLPAEILNALEDYPDLRVLAVSPDGSRSRVEWIERLNHETGAFSVEEFMKIFNHVRNGDGSLENETDGNLQSAA